MTMIKKQNPLLSEPWWPMCLEKKTARANLQDCKQTTAGLHSGLRFNVLISTKKKLQVLRQKRTLNPKRKTGGGRFRSPKYFPGRACGLGPARLRETDLWWPELFSIKPKHRPIHISR